MRLAGGCSRDVGALQFLKPFASDAGAARFRPAATLVSRDSDPSIVALVAANAKPALGWASRPDGTFLIVDGAIYEDTEFYDRAGAPSGDAALALLNLYGAKGREAITGINGAAGIVVWDAAERCLLIVRDRWGVVPFYYAEHNGGVLWSSELGVLLQADIPTDIDRAAVDFFLANGVVPAPWTFVERIRKLPPAHLLSYSPGRDLMVRRYWRPRSHAKLRLSADEATDRLSHYFEKSLRRRWSPDIGTGVLLSSGVDSKLIVGGLCKLLGASIQTFTFRYTDYNGPFNEGDEAKRTATYFGARHHEIEFRPQDIPTNLDWMLRCCGEPFTYGLHSCLLGDVVRAGVSALMSGAGAAYMYSTLREHRALRFARLPGIAQRLGRGSIPALRWLNARAKPLWLWRLYRTAGDLADEAEAVFWCADNELPEDFGGMIIPHGFRDAYYRNPAWLPDARRAIDSLFRTATADFSDESLRDRFVFLDWHFRAAEGSLHWNRCWTRAHGLAVHFPYVDDELCEFELKLPRNSPDKADIRQLAAKLMPRDMAYRPKLPQTVPISHWFRGPLNEFLRDQLAPARIERSGLFDDTTVQKSIDAHVRGRNDHGWKLWAIIMVLAWQDLAARRDLAATPRVPT